MNRIFLLIFLTLISLSFIPFITAQGIPTPVPQQPDPSSYEDPYQGALKWKPIELNGIIVGIFMLVVPIIGAFLLYKYKKTLSFSAWSYMALGVLAIILFISMPIMGRRLSDDMFIPLIIFILSFVPGKIYHKISKKDSKTKLSSTAALLSTFSLIALLTLIIFDLLGNGGIARDFGLAIVIVGPFLFIPHGVGLILLFINWIIQRKQTPKHTFK
jgi:hypothetical protein